MQETGAENAFYGIKYNKIQHVNLARPRRLPGIRLPAAPASARPSPDMQTHRWLNRLGISRHHVYCYSLSRTKILSIGLCDSNIVTQIKMNEDVL